MDPEPVDFDTQEEWRAWLEENHAARDEVWLLIHKKHTGKARVTLAEAVEEALCFGWIDSTLKRLDHDRYILRFTPRKKDSPWSMQNRRRAERLVEDGRMTPAGLAAAEQAKKNGRWDSAYRPAEPPPLPPELEEALKRDPRAWKNFSRFSNSHRTQFIIWLLQAKREETRRRRIEEIVARAARNEKPG